MVSDVVTPEPSQRERSPSIEAIPSDLFGAFDDCNRGPLGNRGSLGIRGLEATGESLDQEIQTTEPAYRRKPRSTAGESLDPHSNQRLCTAEATNGLGYRRLPAVQVTHGIGYTR